MMAPLPRRTPSALAALCLVAAPAAADEGNGSGGAYIHHGPARIGGQLSLQLGSPNLPFGLAVLAVSDGAGPSTSPDPMIGTVCLDLFSPGFYFLVLPLGPTGDLALSFGVPPVPALVGLPPSFALCLTGEGGGFSISKSVRIPFENTDGYSPVASMAEARANHTATSLNRGVTDNRTKVLVTGGNIGDALTPIPRRTTELYSPLSRAFSAGPLMAIERCFHRAALLADGRVLVSGGVTPGGAVTASCEIYDPATNAFAPTGSMTTPRTNHGFTTLDDGRILATGGLADYTNAANDLVTVLNTAQDSAEIYDPATGLWTAVAGAMTSRRSGHRVVRLGDGRLLLTGGISGATFGPFGAEFPTFSLTCELYDPAAGTFSAAPSMGSPRAFHGISLLPGGDVLVTGGSVLDPFLGAVRATDICERFDGTSWSFVGSLPTATAFHTHLVSDQDGTAIVHGGQIGTFPNFSATVQAGRHDGTSFSVKGDLGTNPGVPGQTGAARGGHSITRLYDGSLLLIGGTDFATTFADGFTYLD